MTYEAVLFDNDGVLVELVGHEVLHRATWEAFDALGVSAPDAADVERLAIHVTPSTLADVCATYGLDPERFWAARDHFSSHAQRGELRAERVALYDDFDAVRALDARRGIVSSNQQPTVEFMHDFFGTRHLFETAYGRDPSVEGLRRKKPDPHYVDRALSDLGVARDAALFVGDSESDVRAAHNAGLDSAFLRRPHRADYDLSVTPTHELAGLADLLSLDRVPVRAGYASLPSDADAGA